MTCGEIDLEGRATASAGHWRVAVEGAIPGERVRVRVTRRRGSRLDAAVVEVRRPSPARVAPRCRHAAECGGCAWQHMSYPEQLRLKTRLLETLLRDAFGAAAPEVLPAIGMPVGSDGMPWSFRQKVSFVFGPGPGGRGIRMGHFARGGARIVAVDECPVHAERGNRIAFALRDRLARASIPAAGPSQAGILRHLVIRTASDASEAAAMLVVTRNDRRLRGPVRSLLSSAEAPGSLLINEHDQPGPYMVGPRSIRIAGSGRIAERSLGPTFQVSPESFFQTNVRAASALVDIVLAAASGPAPLRVLDLYCGGGLFSIPLALEGHTVTAVEESRQAVSDARENMRVNHVPASRLRLLAQRVEEALPRLGRDRFDLVVLDPPRQGCAPSVLRAVFGDLAPASAVYVSCNPEALAAELPIIVAAGYRVEEVQPVDMFPHTPHIETAVRLSREEPRRGFERTLPGATSGSRR